MARHPEDVPEPAGLVLEAAVALGKGDEAAPDGARDRDGNLETRFARGFGDVDEDAVVDRLGAGVGEDHGIECGGVAGIGAWSGSLRERDGGDCSGLSEQAARLEAHESLGVTITWSSSVTSMVFSASRMRFVMSMSALEGSGSPEGCGCRATIALA